jgi:uncharacterized protein YndB with AHSA1/START domain
MADTIAETKPFEIERSYDIPRAEMWKAWTERERMTQWWGPKGFTMNVRRLEPRPGGMNHYAMKTPDGHEMWGRAVFREVDAPERMVFVTSFSDPDGGITVHPMNPNWPREMLTTITFTEAGGKTTVHVRWIPINATAQQIGAFDAGHDSMRQGWGGTLDQLGAYVAGRTS